MSYPCPGHNDYLYPLQSLFLFSILKNYRISIGFIIIESMCATYASISSSNPAIENKLSLPYGMFLTVNFTHFNALV